MKLKDIDFRVWNPNRGYLDSAVYYFYKSEADRDDICELEFWTGFRDSNKLDKVFVGDIIKYSWRNQEKIGQVVDWEFNNSCGFNVYAKGEFLSLGVIEILEILGNIHENPELIESLELEN